MDGSTREGVRKDDLAYALMIIRGARAPNREIDCQPVEDKQGIARFIIFDQEGNLQFRKGGQVKLGAKFRSFYINKLQAEATSSYPRIGKPAEISADKALSKKFTCSAKTIEYAEKRKRKLESEGCDIVESLYRKHKVMDERNKARAIE